MRPVRLEMNGFASFRSETVIDFEGTDFFALIGPTGAGKSTVIDAMVFALYGSAPRWGRSNAIQYALAPTTNSATVRLVFDVGNQRYQVAREVRRTGQSIQQRSAVLEKFVDPTAKSATSDEVDPVATEVRDVTPAVEHLLGLSFDDFTKAVVLPQGRFAEFLGATVGERQEILLKLLGAHHYETIMRAAGVRRSAANDELIAIDTRIGDLGGATKEAADEAEAHAESLRLLGDRVAELRTALDAARAEARTSTASVVEAEAQVRRIDAVRIPDGLSDLAERASGVRAEAERARATALEAERAYGLARTALESGGDRHQLERLRDGWAEATQLAETMPALTAAATTAGTALEAASRAASAAEGQWSAAFTTQAEAGRAAEAAELALHAVSAKRDALGALTAPEGVADLAERIDSATSRAAEAADVLTRAEAAEEAAREALRSAGDPVALSTVLARCDAALTLTTKVDQLTRRSTEAATTLGDAHVMAATAGADLERARAVADEARLLVTAAGLRASLEVGHECPVCTVEVTTLPAPIDAAEADAADRAVRQADLASRNARDAVAKAEAEVAGAARAVAEARAQLAEVSPHGSDPAAMRAEAEASLRLVESAGEALDAAEEARRTARAATTAARADASSLEAERREAFAELRAARGALLVHGAPVAESDSLHDSWRELTTWAEATLSELEATALPEAKSAHAEATTRRTDADSHLSGAAEARRAAATATDEARSALVRAEGAVARATERRAELDAALAGLPSAGEVTTQLEALSTLEADERAALEGFRAAGRARDEAARLEQALGQELASADRLLRETRDPLAPLGAPPVDRDDLPGSWAKLADWARTARSSATAGLLEAETLAATADAAAEAAAVSLVEVAVEAGLDVAGPDDVALAVGTASARAADTMARIAADLERLASLHSERSAAEERRQVAAMLAEHLSAKKFQRWLAGAALDVLVEAASSSLLELSGGQFTLAHEKGEFFVVDHADAEARRSVRTLSGGETFQASLALALALSAELSTMSSNATRLDSIFLDEGFGSLDPDSLEVVALTLERLAQGDRLVGVVTHVQGLADRIPTRFSVTRTSRGSAVVREG